jgi:hypothetical protein
MIVELSGVVTFLLSVITGMLFIIGYFLKNLHVEFKRMYEILVRLQVEHNLITKEGKCVNVTS